MRRRAVRRTARRTTRRTARRMRRRFRRRVLIGGMVVLAVGGAAYGAVKLSQKDVERIEQHAGAPVEELSDDELTGAMSELGIQSQPVTDQDRAAMGAAEEEAPEYEEDTQTASYLDELERLAELRERGIITDEEFEAKKKQLLGL